MSAPPYSSGTVMPSTPSSPILRHRSIGNWSLRSISAARGAISACGEVAHRVAQRVDVVAELEVEAGQVSSSCLLGIGQCRTSSRPAPSSRSRSSSRPASLAAVAVDLQARPSTTLIVRPGLRHHALEAEARPARRRQQVDLELDGQHGGVGRHQRERRIAAGRIERGRRRCRHAGSRAAASGSARCAIASTTRPGADFAERDAERRHRRLARERVAHAPFVIAGRRACIGGPSLTRAQLTYTSTARF